MYSQIKSEFLSFGKHGPSPGWVLKIHLDARLNVVEGFNKDKIKHYNKVSIFRPVGWRLWNLWCEKKLLVTDNLPVFAAIVYVTPPGTVSQVRPVEVYQVHFWVNFLFHLNVFPTENVFLKCIEEIHQSTHTQRKCVSVKGKLVGWGDSILGDSFLFGCGFYTLWLW